MRARTSAIASGSVAAALAIGACSGGGVVVAPTRTSSTGTAAAVVSASIGLAASPSAAFVNQGCAATPQAAAPSFDIVILTTRTADLESVTIRLINGTELGGPMITFPSAPLTTQFGTTRLVAGTPRTFTFSPGFVCGPDRPQSVAADLVVVELSGAAHRVTVSRPLP